MFTIMTFASGARVRRFAGMLLGTVAVAAWADSSLGQRSEFSVLRVAQDQPAPSAAPAAPPAQQSAPKPPSSAAITNWQKSLVAHLDRFKRYPAQARGATGVVSLAFGIDRKGVLVSSRIAKSSGSAVLDAEALAMIKRAAPLPPPPAEIADADLSFVVPIRFAAGDRG